MDSGFRRNNSKANPCAESISLDYRIVFLEAQQGSVFVIPAKLVPAVSKPGTGTLGRLLWIPACAGMT